MKQITDHSQFADEFQKLINSKKYSNMFIDTDEKSTVIRLEEQSNIVDPKRNEVLLKVLKDTAGILKNYPEVTKELLEISSREDEEDRIVEQLS
jgi:hypothetical protein